MTTFNPLSVRAFVAHSQLQRKSRARFRIAAGMLLSLLLHGALLFYALSVNTPPPPLGATSPVPAPLMVTLLPSKPVPSAKAPSPTPPEPTRAITPPKPKHKDTVKRPAPPKSAPRPTSPPVSDTARAVQPAAPAADMSTMLEAARARRQAAEASASSENAIARENNRPPSGNEIAQANINFQMRKNQGVSGVFQILNVGPRVAQFRFVGWTNDARDSKRQTITVDAGLNGDVQLAIIDRMIELIRTHYSGDFNWDSQRLGRVVVLSARKSDQDELRRFMMREFF